MSSIQDALDREAMSAYRAHLVSRADSRLNALELGPRTSSMGLVSADGEWADPDKAARAGRKIVITGTPGVGKTTLLKKLAWSLALRRWHPRGGYVPNILEIIKSPKVGEFMEWVRGGDLLVLDDLDKLKGTHYEGEKFLNMLNHFDAYGLPVAVTLNVDLAQFKERIMSGGIPSDYVDSIMSRLMGRMLPMHMIGPDHRRSQ